jgi:hypothetical protein
MAQNSGSGAAPFLAFLVGALLVLVVVIGLAVYGAGFRPPRRDLDVQVQMPTPSLPHTPSLPDPQPTPAPLPQPVPR